MKTLLIMRHADATWDEDQWPDFDRPLNPVGERQAPAMGRRLKGAGYQPDAVICSSAKRTHQTATFVAAELGVVERITPRQELYMGTVADWERTVRGLPEDHSSVLCVGHNPGIQEIILLLRQHNTRVPPATVAIARLAIDHWHEFQREVVLESLDVWHPER